MAHHYKAEAVAGVQHYALSQCVCRDMGCVAQSARAHGSPDMCSLL